MSIGWAGAFCPDKNYRWWCCFSTTHTTMRCAFTTPSPARSSLNPQPLIHLPNAPPEHTPVRVLQEALYQKQRRKKSKAKLQKTNCERRHLNSRDSIFQKWQSWTVVQTILGFWFTFVGCGNLYIISPEWNQWSPYQISGHLRLGYVRLITHNLWKRSVAFIWTEDFGNPGFGRCGARASHPAAWVLWGFSHLRWVPQNLCFGTSHRNQVSKALIIPIWRNHKKPFNLVGPIL